VSGPSILIIEADLVSETLLRSDGVRHSRVAWSNWRPAVHIRPETSYSQARKLFVNLLLYTVILFYFPLLRRTRKSRDSYLGCCFTYKFHTCYGL